MTQSFAPLESLFLNIILATLAIGLPVLLVLSVRFLWERNVNLGRSKELEKLIWQLHRIASAMEHQMNLSFPAVQPGTEEPSDLAYLQQPAAQPAATSRSRAALSAAAPTPAADQSAEQQPGGAPAAVQQTSEPTVDTRAPAGESPRAGVNSMFGL